MHPAQRDYSAELASLGGPAQLGRYDPNPGYVPLYGLLCLASSGASAYHGYKRNDSVGWAIAWGLLGALFPVITPAVAIAQGFGEPAD